MREDVLQSASVVMWRRFGTFEPGTNFVAWATTIAFYEVRNFQRVTGRSRVEFDDELMKTLAAERATHVLEWPARMSALEVCLQKLDEADRALIQAIYLEGREIGALAQSLGRAPQTLYNKLSAIRRALVECVQRETGGGAFVRHATASRVASALQRGAQ